ncbi:MAG: PKD domain-containing protein, partial [Sandaracinaceae bacterium]|nr:PKD domain-containing protein [Sandaracinaceae bacterium]
MHLCDLARATFLTILLLATASCSPPSDEAGATHAALEVMDAGGSTGVERCPPGANIIVGTEGPDVLIGTSGPDCIFGLGGDDYIEGRQGDDTIFGGDGDDVIHGGSGRDHVFGEAGDDIIQGDQQDDVLDGGEGNDRLFGGNGRDWLKGGPGDDYLDGENGKDTIWGGDGCDQIDGANGNDTIFGGPGDDAIVGGRAPERINGDEGDDLITTSGPPPTSVIFGGPGIDACAGYDCELPPPSRCVTDAECPGGNRCLEVGICAPSTWCAGCRDDDATCDELDDDCDGLVDEDYAPEATSCGVGACHASGVTACVAGGVVDSCAPGTPAPNDATCDGLDDDCDGLVDEDYAPEATSCGAGACHASGVTACVAGAVVDSCAPGSPAPNDATCDGLDDDCDGFVDEDYAPEATSCGAGACHSSGVTACVAGAVVDSCAPGSPAPNDATCDGLDDDCDGVVDEDYAPEATSCGVGACHASGVTACVAGAVVDSCAPGSPAPNDATCDGLDDDCDGLVDEDYAPEATSCGVGACHATGVTACVAGAVVDSCAPGSPAPNDATCDGLDDDCDGAIDEDFVPYCAADSVVACFAGVEVLSTCDDGDACNGAETCAAATCLPGVPSDLDDGNPCTHDACDPAVGVVHTPLPAGTSCDEGDVCDGESVCDGAAVCVAGTPPELDDGNPCTANLCDPVVGVSHPPLPAGTSCDDDDPCNGLETCDGAGTCVRGPRPLEGPCVPAPPLAAIFVDERRDVMNATVGASIVSFDGPDAPDMTDDGLRWFPSTQADGAADVVVAFARPEVIAELRLRSSVFGVRELEVWASERTTADADFDRVVSVEVAPHAQIQRFPFQPVSARFVRIRVLRDGLDRPGTGTFTEATLWTQSRDGGAVSLYDAGVPVTASAGAHPRNATDFDPSTVWSTFGAGVPVEGQTLTVDLPGTGYHRVDRVRLWGGGSTAQLRAFEILVSDTTDAPESFRVVMSGVLPRPSNPRDYWYFFDPVRARHVRLRTIDNYGFAGAVQVAGWTVFTPHEGGLTVPFSDRSTAGGEPIVAWRWDFGDGRVSHERHPVHTYGAPGTYVVRLEVIDAYGLTSVSEHLYTAHGPPIADFVATPLPVRQGDVLTVRDTSSPSGAPLVRVGITPEGAMLPSGINAFRTVHAPGGFTGFSLPHAGSLRVTLDVTDAALLHSSVTRDIMVQNVPPSIDVGEDQTLIWGEHWRPKDPIVLTDVTSAEWFSLVCSYDFGDGRVVGPSPCTPTNFYVAHGWSDPGTYRVHARATDLYGDTSEDTFIVEVVRREATIALAPVPGASYGGAQAVTAQLIDSFDPTTPVAGRMLTFALGAQLATAITGPDGRATVTLDFPAGASTTVVASFAGDTHYVAARGENRYPELLRPTYPGNCGTDYWIAIPNPCADAGTCPTAPGAEPSYRHNLYFSAEASTAVRVDMPGVGRTANVFVGESGIGMLELPLDVPGRGAVRATSTVLDDSIHITSDRVVCVHELSFIKNGAEGFLALPTSTLGTDYVVGAAPGYVQSSFVRWVGQFVVVATEDGTDVTLVPSYWIEAGPIGLVSGPGVPRTVRLNRGQVVQIRAFTNPPGPTDTFYDLTGTTVTSTAPVAVISGHMCGYVPSGTQACNTLLEQIPPTEVLGTEYLLTPFARRTSGYFARAVATRDGTEVRLDGSLVATLARGQVHDIDVPTQTAHALTTSHPALVYQLAKGIAAEAPGSVTGDPVMLLAVPPEQFDNGATVATVPSREFSYFDGGRTVRGTWAYEHFLNLVVPLAEAGGVRVDGAPVVAPFAPIGSSGWVYAQVPVGDGVHRVTHVSPAVPVGVSIYGWADADGYAYPARLRMTDLAGGCTPTPTAPGDGIDNDCDGRWDEELANGLDDDGDGLADEDLVFEAGAPVNLAPFAYDRFDTVPQRGHETLIMTGFDPNGDAITFEVLTPTVAGTLVGSGPTRTYTPAPDYVGPDAFTYRVCDASLCSAPATFSIQVQIVNRPPVIAMGGFYTAFEGELFELALDGSDPEGQPLVWSLIAGPAGLAVDAERERLYWTPDRRFVDFTSPVTVAATDPDGSRTEVTFGVRVLQRPAPPFITSSPVRTAQFNLLYVYDVEAHDPNTTPLYTPVLEYLLLVAPAGMSIDAATGLITWVPTLADAGAHPVEIVVRDDTSLMSEPQRFEFVVRGDSRSPAVTIAHTPDPVLPGDTVTLVVTATDDDVAFVEGLTVGGGVVPLDATGTGTWIATAPGRFTAEASAVDPSGNRGFGTAEVRVLDPSDTTPPFVALRAPAPNDILTYLHDATGTVRDEHLHRWWLEMRPADGGPYRTMASGTNTVEDAHLAELDVTQVRNGIWHLRLRAEDINGEQSSVEIPVRVQGGAKLGLVRLELTDLVMRDFGIPIAVNRVYDSREVHTVGDFGHGWTLDLRQGSIQHNYVVGEGVAVYTNAGDRIPCQRFEDQLGHFAEVRLGDDEWYTFRPIVTSPAMLSGGCSGDVGYELVDGTRAGAELRIIGPRNVRARAIEVVRAGAFAAESQLISTEDDSVFDPQEFELLLPDGRRFGLDAQRGVVWLEDPNGNSLTIVEPSLGFGGGLVHSSGRYVVFDRDARGRIRRIADGAGRSVSYAYDAAGNLASFSDPIGRVTRYEYEAAGHPHHLTAIVDWRGVRTAAIEYEAAGRMRALCDADGVCMEQQYDLAAQSVLRFTGLPSPTRYAYDDRGNVVRIEDGLGHTQLFTYSPAPWNNLIERQDAGGRTRYLYHPESTDVRAEILPTAAGEDPNLFRTDHTQAYVFDGTRFLTVRTGTTLPSGGTLHYEHDSRGNPTRVLDDEGAVILARTYHPNGSLATLTDRFGTTNYEYGSDGQPTRITGPDGTVTELEHDAAGHLSRLRRGGVTQRFVHDPAGRRLYADYGNGVTVRYEYADSDAWTAIEGPTFGRVERRLSASGRLLSWTEPNGDTFTQRYDAAGQLRRRIDALGNVTEHVYDAAGHLVEVVDAARGATTRYARDPLGRVITQTAPDGTTRSFTYDPRGNIATTTDERGHVTAHATLPAESSVTDALSNTTVHHSTPYGLPASTRYPGGASTSTTFHGRTHVDASASFPLTQVDEQARTRAFQYDAQSVLTGATDLGGNAWRYEHTEVLGGEVDWDV